METLTKPPVKLLEYRGVFRGVCPFEKARHLNMDSIPSNLDAYFKWFDSLYEKDTCHVRRGGSIRVATVLLKTKYSALLEWVTPRGISALVWFFRRKPEGWRSWYHKPISYHTLPMKIVIQLAERKVIWRGRGRGWINNPYPQPHELIHFKIRP